MASAVIHLAVAKKLESSLEIDDEKSYFLGVIAPDLSKQIGEDKTKSHFVHDTLDNVPNIDYFKEKYPDFKNNDFLLGYYVHLFTDKEWFKNFLPNIKFNDSVRLLDGTIIKVGYNEFIKLVYNDYTNLNKKLIANYEIDMSLFYEKFKAPKISFDEIPVEKLDLLIEKMKLIIEKSKEEKEYLFDNVLIDKFIDDCKYIILRDLM